VNTLMTALHGVRREVAATTIVAHNLANIATPGFKRWVTGEKGAYQDLSLGAPLVTGRKLDVLLPRGVFFQVSGEGGAQYVSSGSLWLDAEGKLRSSQGGEILLEGVDVLPYDVEISPDAQLQVDGSVLARIKLVSGEQLAIDASGYSQLKNVSPLNRDEIVIQTGVVENSNVQLTDEIIQVMQTLRRIESLQKVLKQEEALHARLFDALSKF
jgi:flagellar basal-body rod protein FlgF